MLLDSSWGIHLLLTGLELSSVLTAIPKKISNEVAGGIAELYQKYKCNYCEEEIGGLRIKCAECTDFDLCLDCFACGAQIAKHKSTHKYMFMNNGGFGIFQNPNSVSNLGRMAKRASVLKAEEERDKKIWNARDEMRLLDAVEQVRIFFFCRH